MNAEHHDTEQQKRLGGRMIAIMWLLLLALMYYLFSAVLDQQHNPNQSINTLQRADGVRELVLQRNHYGHYVASGQINGYDVVFMLDTGATDISVPVAIADKIGLKKGRELVYQTANGKARVYATQLERVSLGDISLHKVRATINPNVRHDDILLGMSFLKHLEFTQRGERLTLRQYPDND